MNLNEYALRYYLFNSEHRQYHNYYHARSVVDTVELLLKTIPVSELTKTALPIAALWHDAVYIPGSNVNEAASADALTHSYIAESKSKPTFAIPALHAATKLIMSTTVQDHFRANTFSLQEQESGIGILLDADLFGLSLPYDEFVINQNNIILENHGDPTVKQSRCASVNFLSALVGRREFIYHTEYARLTWEDSAQSNIKKYYEEVYAN